MTITLTKQTTYTVQCLSGAMSERFDSRHDARMFAEWGHVCLGWHLLTQTDAAGKVLFEDVMTGGGHTTVAQFRDKQTAFNAQPKEQT